MHYVRAAFSLVVFLGFFLSSRAQEGDERVLENKSPLIEALQKERASLARSGGLSRPATEGERSPNGERRSVPGFRVQIYSGPSREEAYAAQARFRRVFKDLGTYVSYEQPNYRVKVGDFTSRSEAQALSSELKKKFNSVFIFSETVNLEP